MSKEIILEELKARKQELLTEVIPHFHSGNAERGRIAFRRWKERFGDFLKVSIPTEVSHFEAAMTHYAWVVKPGEHPYDMFMREDGNTCLAIIDDLADSIQKGRISSNKKVVKPAPRQNRISSRSPKTSRWVWIPALVFTSLLGAFLILAYFVTPAMTGDQKSLVHLFSALLAGFSASFMGGTALLKLEFPQNSTLKVILSATAGVAVFVFVYSVNTPFTRTNTEAIEYTGRVVDAETNKAIHNAKVSIEQDKRIPEVYQTDSEGVFHLRMLATPKEVRLRVEATGYEVIDRLVGLNRTGIEDIRLTNTSRPVSPTASSTRVLGPSRSPTSTPSQTPSPKPSWDLIESWIRRSFSEGTPIESVKKVDDPDCTNACQKAIVVLKDSSNANTNRHVTVSYKLERGRWQWHVSRDY